ncbi:MAG: SMP-30/gluconolactonase/LRE family protein [Myxococcales bacterium]|nr:SMP-30/gluconolactonase/LRE family protein [Myxococcales bacterium]
MRHSSRLRVLFAVTVTAAAATYLYACSSSDPAPAIDDTPETGTPDPPNPDPPKPPADGGGGGDDAGDLDATAPKTCTVNPIIDGGAPREIARGQFLDGPHWVDALGGLVMSEFNTATIVRVGPDGGALTNVRAPFGNGQPIGNSALKDYLVTAAVQPSRLILTALPDAGDGGRVPILPDGGQAPNDLVISSSGNMYVTDPAYQAANPQRTSVLRVSPTGVTSLVQSFIAAGPLPLPRPNGIALSPDEKTLYVSITEPKRIIAYPVNADGSTGAGKDLVAAADLDLAPDGLAVDVGGNIYVAEAVAQGGGNPNRGVIEVFKPDGKKWGAIPIAGQRPTGLAFGADNKTLYVTTERNLLVLSVACEGIR